MNNILELCDLSSDYMGDGELFISNSQLERIVMQDGIIHSIDMNKSNGLSLRCINEREIYFYATTNTSTDYMKSIVVPNVSLFAKKTKLFKLKGYHERQFYPITLNNPTPLERINLLKEIHTYLKNNCKIIKKTSIIEACRQDNIHIYSKNGLIFDERPLFSLRVSAVITRTDGTYETLHESFSQRFYYDKIIETWKSLCDELIRKCLVVADSKPISGGTMTVLLGPGVPAVLLHEAIGHSLESDFNRKQTSVFTDKIGTKIASNLVTVIDDGTIPHSRGTTNFDDEGTPTERTTLIKDGILTNYMFDKYNALLMNKRSTGNGRRQSFEYQPMPRMTNTIMLNGTSSVQSMIESVDYGIMAMDFGSGQVDITSGQFSFNGSEAYLIRNGKIDHPIQKCVISGMGSDVMQNIVALGNNFALDPSGGTCGKNGQCVPVNLGQPSVLITKMVVG